MEANVAVDMSQSEIVDNPFCVNLAEVPDWPASNSPWKLACVGRIDFQSKAQDVLLQALRGPKWRQRDFKLTFFGSNFGNEAQLRALIELYGLQEKVQLGGFVDNVASVWRDHHALVLPSRIEGNALAMIEAMACSRVPIVTNVGRVATLIDDNTSGFVAAAPTAGLIDDALERAWLRREDWQSIGAAAAASIRQRHSLNPPEDFAAKLVDVVRHLHTYGSTAKLLRNLPADLSDGQGSLGTSSSLTDSRRTAA
jgi:glycosyltransferase involved in cell wall biosynthesis